MTAEININLVDNYYGLIQGLSHSSKRQLVQRLSKSLETTENLADDSLKSLCGALALDNSVDKFTSELKKERNFERKSISF